MKALITWLGNFALEILVVCAVFWATLAMGATWGWGFPVTFGLLAAAFCVWVGIRLLAEENGSPESPEGHQGGAGNDNTEPDGSSSPSAEGRQFIAPPLRVSSRGGVLFVGLIAAYLFLQILPLPTSVVSILSPARVAQERELREALGESVPPMLTISVDRATSGRSMALVAVAAMAFALGAYLGTSRLRARRVVVALLVLVAFEALYGLMENLTGHMHIFWIPVEGEHARGTFVNRNHYAATLSMLLPLAIGWFFFSVSRTRRRIEETRLRGALPWELLATRQALWLFIPAVLALGVIQSYSRGGFSAMILGTALFFALAMHNRAAKTLAWMAIPLAVAIFSYGINSDYQVVLDRFGDLVSDVESEGRTTIWNDSLGIVRDYPVFGVGLGNFPRLYMQYASVSTLTYPYMAHNEWLEGLITLGFFGMALVVVAVAALLWRALRVTLKAGPDRWWMLGAWCGLIALAFHCFAEFNLHIPSITLTVALLSGMLLGFDTSVSAAAAPRKRRKRAASRGRERAYLHSVKAIPVKIGEHRKPKEKAVSDGGDPRESLPRITVERRHAKGQPTRS